MAQVAEAAAVEGATETETPQANESESIIFGGTPRNLVPGMALLVGGVLAFFMNMTELFFAEAMAWIFIIWGILLIYIGLADSSRSFEVTEEALLIHDGLRPWSGHKTWSWDHINRLDVITHKRDVQLTDATMQVYCLREGELAVSREDRQYDPELAQLIIERADLNPAGGHHYTVHTLPMKQKATYTWQ